MHVVGVHTLDIPTFLFVNCHCSSYSGSPLLTLLYTVAKQCTAGFGIHAHQLDHRLPLGVLPGKGTMWPAARSFGLALPTGEGEALSPITSRTLHYVDRDLQTTMFSRMCNQLERQQCNYAMRMVLRRDESTFRHQLQTGQV
jgi:hypothetical protein